MVALVQNVDGYFNLIIIRAYIQQFTVLASKVLGHFRVRLSISVLYRGSFEPLPTKNFTYSTQQIQSKRSSRLARAHHVLFFLRYQLPVIYSY